MQRRRTRRMPPRSYLLFKTTTGTPIPMSSGTAPTLAGMERNIPVWVPSASLFQDVCSRIAQRPQDNLKCSENATGRQDGGRRSQREDDIRRRPKKQGAGSSHSRLNITICATLLVAGLFILSPHGHAARHPAHWHLALPAQLLTPPFQRFELVLFECGPYLR